MQSNGRTVFFGPLLLPGSLFWCREAERRHLVCALTRMRVGAQTRRSDGLGFGAAGSGWQKPAGQTKNTNKSFATSTACGTARYAGSSQSSASRLGLTCVISQSW